MLDRIVSGGQTGVDRAALDAALEAGIAHGGWCPYGRRAEDGRIPARYQLSETESRQYPERTRLNVEHSDATLILNTGKLQGGTRLSYQYAKEHARPWRLVALDEDANPAGTHAWIQQHKFQILNVAGPRESTCPGIYRLALTYLQALLALLALPGSPDRPGRPAQE